MSDNRWMPAWDEIWCEDCEDYHHIDQMVEWRMLSPEDAQQIKDEHEERESTDKGEPSAVLRQENTVPQYVDGDTGYSICAR